jgi:hypothetical protein
MGAYQPSLMLGGQVREPGIISVIARRGTKHGSRLGIYRRMAEAAFALLHWFRRASGGRSATASTRRS